MKLHKRACTHPGEHAHLVTSSRLGISQVYRFDPPPNGSSLVLLLPSIVRGKWRCPFCSCIRRRARRFKACRRREEERERERDEFCLWPAPLTKLADMNSEMGDMKVGVSCYFMSVHSFLSFREKGRYFRGVFKWLKSFVLNSSSRFTSVHFPRTSVNSRVLNI